MAGENHQGPTNTGSPSNSGLTSANADTTGLPDRIDKYLSRAEQILAALKALREIIRVYFRR